MPRQKGGGRRHAGKGGLDMCSSTSCCALSRGWAMAKEGRDGNEVLAVWR